MEERMNGFIKEHKHSGYDYWHNSIIRHAEYYTDELHTHQIKQNGR